MPILYHHFDDVSSFSVITLIISYLTAHSLHTATSVPSANGKARTTPPTTKQERKHNMKLEIDWLEMLKAMVKTA